MRRESYPEFSHRLALAAKKGLRPLRVMFELTYRCDFHCGHCYIPGSCRSGYAERELRTGQVEDILSQLKDAGCLYLGFTGGEPLLRPDVLDILAFCRDRGFITTLYTNAGRIDASMARELKRLAVSKVDLTLPALSEPVFRGVTGVRGARDRVFAALRHLKENDVPHSLKACALSANRGELAGLRALARRQGLFLRVAEALYPSWDGGVRPLRLGLAPACGRTGKRRLFSCGAGLSQAAITPAGELKPCLMINRPKADILRLGFKRAWASLNRFASKARRGPPSARRRGWCPAVTRACAGTS